MSKNILLKYSLICFILTIAYNQITPPTCSDSTIPLLYSNVQGGRATPSTSDCHSYSWILTQCPGSSGLTNPYYFQDWYDTYLYCRISSDINGYCTSGSFKSRTINPLNSAIYIDFYQCIYNHPISYYTSTYCNPNNKQLLMTPNNPSGSPPTPLTY